jgi:hypothetical protein
VGFRKVLWFKQLKKHSRKVRFSQEKHQRTARCWPRITLSSMVPVSSYAGSEIRENLQAFTHVPMGLLTGLAAATARRYLLPEGSEIKTSPYHPTTSLRAQITVQTVLDAAPLSHYERSDKVLRTFIWQPSLTQQARSGQGIGSHRWFYETNQRWW